MNLEKQIRAYLVAVRKDVTQQINNQDLIASGRMKNNFRVVANQHLVGEIRGVFYMDYLQKGFTYKPRFLSKKFIDNIIEWMRFKNIAPKRDGEIVPNTATNIRRSATGIAIGIINNGTPVTRGAKGLDIDGAMQKHLDPYLKAIGKEFLKTFDKNLKIK